MPILAGVVERCADLWGAVILQATRDARKVGLVVPEEPRQGERMRPFLIRRQKAQVDLNAAHRALAWFRTSDFRYICSLCGADPGHILDQLRLKEGLKV